MDMQQKDLAILALIGRIGVEGAPLWLGIHGEALEKLGLDDRFTLSNMAIEAGKTGLIKLMRSSSIRPRTCCEAF